MAYLAPERETPGGPELGIAKMASGSPSGRNEPLIHWNSMQGVLSTIDVGPFDLFRRQPPIYLYTYQTHHTILDIGCAFIIRHCFFSDFMSGCLCLCFYIVWGIISILFVVCFLPNKYILGANYIWLPTALKSTVLGIISPVMVCSIPSYRAIKTIKTPL